MTIRRGDSIIAGNSADIPSQTGQSGKFLTTNGTTTSWATVNVDTSDIYNKIDTKQDKSTAVNYNNITNCITEIPQDIKLELNNGTLTLKAGSKVYVPNGIGVFDVVTVQSDVIFHSGTIGDGIEDIAVFCNLTGGFGARNFTSGCVSGTKAPSNTGFIWYDTTNNMIKGYENGAWVRKYSFPICIYHRENGKAISIDQVFNGFGHIGSTVFALPGVKGLIPNGRNADGSLKNIEFTISQVQTFSITSKWGTGVEGWWLNGTNMDIHRAIVATYFQDSKPSTSYQDAYWFSPKENILRQTTDTGATWTQIQGSYSFNISFTSGKITSLTSKTVFHALDYNDKSTISGWSMPSSRYIDLTLGASGSRYTAPANGWFNFDKRSSATGQYVVISNETAGYVWEGAFTSYGNSVECFKSVPVKKGDTIKIVYTLGGATLRFAFIFAEGESYNPVSNSNSGSHEVIGPVEVGDYRLE